MKKLSLLIVVSIFSIGLNVLAVEPEGSQNLTTLIVSSLKEIQTIKVGMTRDDLFKVFTTEGGLSSGLRRTYVYRECPYIKVDVVFQAIGRNARDAEGRVTLVESDKDVIEKLSRPYLEWSVGD